MSTCLVLEGGALRGVYTTGVLLGLARHNIHFDCVMGISAGCLNGLSWVSGQLDRAARINTAMVDDPDYLGKNPLISQRSVINFHMLFEGKSGVLEPFDWRRFYTSPVNFITAATRGIDGQQVIFEKRDPNCNMRLAAQASCSIPGLTPGLSIDGEHYFDGGMSDPCLLHLALERNYDKIVVVLTQQDLMNRGGYSKTVLRLMRIRLRQYPAIHACLRHSEDLYHRLGEDALRYEKEGRIFVLEPSRPVDINFREHDPARMQSYLNLGQYDLEQRIGALLRYLQA